MSFFNLESKSTLKKNVSLYSCMSVCTPRVVIVYYVVKKVTFTSAAVKSEVLLPLHKHEKWLKSCMCYKK